MNYTKESAYDMAWNSILSFQNTSNSETWQTDRLLEMFPNADACMETRKLTQLHKIVMGILHISLKQEIMTHSSLIDQPDADGRTPLHWAAARGNSEAVRVLLEHGASPDKSDFIQQGPLRASLKADSPDCLELLLKAGATVDQRDKWKQTCLIASMYYPYPETFASILLSYDADVNATDGEGRSPILEAVRNDHVSAVRVLLKHNVNINAASEYSGMTPLQEGVVNCTRTSVSVLLTRNINHTVLDKEGRTVLHHAALHADVPMLRLLALARMRGLDPRLKDQYGHTAANLARQRLENLREERGETPMKDVEIADLEVAISELLFSVSIPLRVKTSVSSFKLEHENSDSDDTASFHSAIDHFAELNIV